MSNNSKQAGGTVLGVILGLIVGLGIAVVVAVAITKTPVPFLNKNAKPERAPDASNRQATDPNRPLYGNRDAVKEAAKEFAKGADDDQATQKTPPVAKTPPPKEEPKDDFPFPPVVETPVPEKPEKPKKQPKDETNIASIKRPAEEKPSIADRSEDKWTYFLQAGAFRSQSDAENTRAKLALAGFEARITELQSSSGVLYRVRIGPFGQAETMNRMRGKLSDNGVDVAVVRTPR